MKRFQKGFGQGRGFTLVELLVVILIISVLAGFLVPTLLRSRMTLYRVQCKNRLHQLGQFALFYADEHQNWLPVKRVQDPRAYESFQLIVDAFPDAREPDMYTCPVSQDRPADFDPQEDKIFTLTEENVSYAWINEQTRTTGGGGTRVPIGADDSLADKEAGIRENHSGGINIVYLDASVKWRPKDMLKDNEAFRQGGLTEYLAMRNISK